MNSLKKASPLATLHAQLALSANQRAYLATSWPGVTSFTVSIRYACASVGHSLCYCQCVPLEASLVYNRVLPSSDPFVLFALASSRCKEQDGLVSSRYIYPISAYIFECASLSIRTDRQDIVYAPVEARVYKGRLTEPPTWVTVDAPTWAFEAPGSTLQLV